MENKSVRERQDWISGVYLDFIHLRFKKFCEIYMLFQNFPFEKNEETAADIYKLGPQEQSKQRASKRSKLGRKHI